MTDSLLEHFLESCIWVRSYCGATLALVFALGDRVSNAAPTGSLLLWENGDRVAVERVDFVVELEHI